MIIVVKEHDGHYRWHAYDERGLELLVSVDAHQSDNDCELAAALVRIGVELGRRPRAKK